LNGGSIEAIARYKDGVALPLAYTGGSGASDTPVGGVYAGAESAPAADAIGGVVFLARIAGGATAEAIVYRPGDGNARPIVVGDAAPGSQSAGFFAGPPFSAPLINDRGDVVFRSFVARGPASVGIFRRRDGKLEAVVRAGDPSPNPGSPPFLDILGEPSLNQAGDVAFAALVPGRGRGIYVASAEGIRRAVGVSDPAPGIPGTRFANIAPNPSLNDAGTVAFRGTTVFRDSFSGLSIRHEGLFLVDAAGVRVVVFADEPSPSGQPYFKLRDPFLSNVPSVVFRASLGTDAAETSGLFVADANGTVQLIGERSDLGNGERVTTLSGDPAIGAGGEVAFLANRQRQSEPGSPLFLSLGPAILRDGPGGLAVVAAREMPGPVAGLFRTVSAPAVAAGGHVVFRGSFLPETGGTAGLFLATEAGIQPYVLVKEQTSIGGQFTAFSGRASLNTVDEIAFTGSVVKGTARTAVFAASPTTFRTDRLRLRPRGARMRISVRGTLGLGRLSDGVRPAREPVTISLGDTGGTLWSAKVPRGALERRGKGFAAAPARGSDLAGLLRGLRLQVLRNGQVRVTATSARVDLGKRPLGPRLTVTLEVGDDSGSVSFPCDVGPHGAQCGG
jgi:hypothetical protein